MERFSLSELLLTVRLVETDLAALGVSLDGPGWKVGTDSQWDERDRWYQGGGAEAMLGRGCPSPRGAKCQAQLKGTLLFHSHGTRWNRGIPSSTKRPMCISILTVALATRGRDPGRFCP